MLQFLEDHPRQLAIGTGAMVLLVSSIWLLLGWWLIDAQYVNRLESLRLPLIMFGVSIIFISTLLIEKSLVLALSIFIIGTIVATDEFLLRLSLALTRQVPQDENFYTFANRSQNNYGLGAVTTNAQVQLEDQAGDKFSTAVTEASIAQLAYVVEVLGARDILDTLNLIPQQWANTVRSRRRNQEFLFTVDLLSALGIINCRPGDLLSCTTTQLGSRIQEYSSSPTESFSIAVSRPTSITTDSSQIIPISNNTVQEIPITVSAEDQIKWFSFTIDENSSCSISLRSSNGDPLLYLFSSESPGEVLERDDDGGEGFNSLVETVLQPGQYVIAATAFSIGAAPTDLTLNLNTRAVVQ